MNLNIKNKETFIEEIDEIKRVKDYSTIEAIVEYAENYGLDFEYINQNLMSSNIREVLEEEATRLKLLKPDNSQKLSF